MLEQVRAWQATGQTVAVATVAEVLRSAPLPVGTKLAVNARGELCGAVSGGCVEAAVVEQAERVLAGAAPTLMHYGLSDDDAWEIGLPCGGEISVWVEALAPDGLTQELMALAAADRRAVLVRRVDGEDPDRSARARPRALLLRDDASQSGSLGSARLDAAAARLATQALWSEQSGLIRVAEAGATLFVEVTAPRPRLIIVGAVDFAVHLVTAARLAGWRPYVIDPRPRFAVADRFPTAEAVIAAWPQEAFGRLDPPDPATAIAVLTHDPKVDDAALAVALRSGAGYIGAMGSRPAQRRRRARLQEAGFSEADIDRISAPIGLDLGAQTAGETALSIMGEIVALRRRRGGGRLIHATGRIHSLSARSGDERGDQARSLLL
ncbi:MAG TPA: XdhC family protein [Solirubrobacteraceae bacterium]|nr:XdhC family protein [Solirubrobacteraceae bacterium]